MMTMLKMMILKMVIFWILSLLMKEKSNDKNEQVEKRERG